MSNPEQIFRVLGDGLSIASLSMIASMSLTAWKRIPKDVKVPMQWSKEGVPTWRTSKLIGLLFTPIMATVLLFVPTVMGATRGQTDLQAIIVVFAIRAVAAAAFVFIFMHFLRQVYQTLADEGSLSV
jgi:hypothetical protein